MALEATETGRSNEGEDVRKLHRSLDGATQVKRPALLIEPLADVTGLHGEPVKLLVKINELIERLNRLIEAEAK